MTNLNSGPKDSSINDGSPLRVLFPQYWKLDTMVRGELTDLDDATLDWTSSEFGWAGWSIRTQASHLASLVYRWLLVRWGDQLFAGGLPVSEDELAALNSERYDRRLDEERYWEPEQILTAMGGAMELAQSVLRRISVAEGKTLVVSRTPTPQWQLMTKAHPHGVTLTDDGGGTMTLEATFRHIYFEYLTHMHNMQRIKRELGKTVVVKLPNEGYHTVDGWE